MKIIYFSRTDIIDFHFKKNSESYSKRKTGIKIFACVSSNKKSEKSHTELEYHQTMARIIQNT